MWIKMTDKVIFPDFANEFVKMRNQFFTYPKLASFLQIFG
ncbi:hypothetical protein J502_0318 [Acinetobacter sp. 1294596]|jgi:hypothetical protein|uniref:Uncharacterized protein n=1 Tax=Acinetobacter radioresistens SK82 TaxID=596318 RepID=A0ABP2GLS3_ACIRA|nr:hypothetical protein ACIRA0001_3036 [Acinetobacter radioresistens SK82]EXB87731.1 hypothetical protein J538_0298 [Acinetobacter sp. 272263]EXC34810.1 hypothetical protein J520_0085 [Acinetobacter sp. 869535]EXE59791.1 hypothetical protein J579_0551 [Acinetobacter sp. 1239920]EXF58459.1 hypothetical protein J502_0318 [Acinetobacter sp. 1294596]